MPQTLDKVKAQQFWDLYFQNKFVELQRTATAVKGKYAHDLPPGKPFLSEPDYTSIALDTAELKLYAYEQDGRFSEIQNSPKTLQETILKIRDGSYPFREPPPYGSKRMKELFEQMFEQFKWPPDASVSPEQVKSDAQSLAAPFVMQNGQPLTALLWILGETRERFFSNVMIDLIEADGRLPRGHKDRMPSTLVNTALESLWKINDKTHLERLLKIMDHADHSGRLRIAALFKRLLSTNELLSLYTLEEKYYSVGYWQEFIAPFAGYSENDWNRYDTKSIFWEIRFLAATRLTSGDEALKRLQSDEVSLIRDTAISKTG